MDRATIAVYEEQAAAWRDRRPLAPELIDTARRFHQTGPDGRRLDLGCGVGRLLPHLGDVIGLDASPAMLSLARATDRPLVAGDLEALPLAASSADAAWAEASYQHLPGHRVPMALWDLHRVLKVGGAVRMTVITGDGPVDRPNDDLPGRLFHGWTDERLVDTFHGAGFEGVVVSEERPGWRAVEARRARSLADTVGAGMHLLLCGFNPSLHAADRGVGYVGPGNRFWPAVADSLGLDRPDPVALLRSVGIGMTDIAKRATPAAADLERRELRAGMARVERLVTWLQPRGVCFVGLSGYRAVVDRAAVPGPQPLTFGGRPVYVMPSTSGRNATSSRADLGAHLADAVDMARSAAFAGDGG